MGLIQVNGQEVRSNQQFRVLNEDYFQAFLRTIFAYAVFFPVVEFITSATTAALIFYAGIKLKAGAITWGLLLAFVAVTLVVLVQRRRRTHRCRPARLPCGVAARLSLEQRRPSDRLLRRALPVAPHAQAQSKTRRDGPERRTHRPRQSARFPPAGRTGARTQRTLRP